METSIHDMNALFAQLGLEESNESIENFIITHKPIPEDMELYEAEFWSNSQADFLKESIAEDSDWAVVVDHLNVLLRD
ncbi:DUF2789 domain-containing protein [uncultured Cocleimonas sp.]|uniref:DUF2789 domain-containing protein n=1 Tax=uncultured Cocleimonas sp. TaxID=1051587 RepID=UPI002635DF05|nr:DUF2789 domain-containing protein [uncultured Cocleimonas sp.]